MKHGVLGIVIMLFFVGCSVKYDALHVKRDGLETLTQELMHLGENVSYPEARLLAYEALSYPQTLAKKYGLVSPPTFHNFLINTGIKERGLCYEWSEDMMAHLKKGHYESFDLRWGVANKGAFDEHNSVVVVAKNAPFPTGILLDPWRNSGVLYWGKLNDDPSYVWVENSERSRYYGTIQP
ncbi:hypothetical protein [Sulfurospirillum barnesii]|uniref:Uncharacterized protein n=1 Tax=Sulfurospirillum barnesii (strain ATCC 700032 / DSM 10660 / SES-3) TaxID=760154 RepID=I3Y0P9_SULBS|nr:hypothetical protein [Sulfurospirillum barnesii]AFL69773.1 hypothetical protein Sulba_2506 [Sulfurospirillum barnesii SES-3]